MCRPACRRPDVAGAKSPIACLCAPTYDVPPRSIDHAHDRAILAKWHVDPRRPRRIRTSSSTAPFCHRKPTRPIVGRQPAPAAASKPGEQVGGHQRPRRPLVQSPSIASPRPSKIARLLRPRSPRNWSGSTSIRCQPWPTPASSGPSARDACAATPSTSCAPTCSMVPIRRRTRQASGAPVRSAWFARPHFPSAAPLTGRAAP